MPAEKFIQNQSGTLAEKRAIQQSAGAADGGKIPALGDDGFFDDTLFRQGPDVKTFPATEALAAGDFVNVYDATGTPSARKADASSLAKRAWGFVLTAVTNGSTATVYFEGRNTSVSSQAVGPVFLSATQPGKATATAPSTGGQIIQPLGIAVGATEINTEIDSPILLAA